jgi:hypothetical protein
MAHTTAWDETKPAGSDLASTLDTQGQQHKRDERERLALEHYWATALSGATQDGIHKEISITPTAANKELVKTNAGQSVTGAAATPGVDLAATWNTSGAPTAVKFAVTDTASDAAALLLNFLVDAVSKLALRKDGLLTIGGQYYSPMQRHAACGAAETINWSLGNEHRLILDENVTLTLSNPVDGGRYVIMFVQDGSGGNTVTWPVGAVLWPAGSAPTITSGANVVTVVTLLYDGLLGKYLGACNADLR